VPFNYGLLLRILLIPPAQPLTMPRRDAEFVGGRLSVRGQLNFVNGSLISSVIIGAWWKNTAGIWSVNNA
jgi:hypothetical protein